MRIEHTERSQLLELARASIHQALAVGSRIELSDVPSSARLSADGASFVTLTAGDALRGCCGSVVATRPLAEDVWRNAQRTAFDDPRFPALVESEVEACAIAISVLGPLESLHVSSQEALIAQLRPGVDGLLLRHQNRQATFLPKVWEKLPEPGQFLSQLNQKMGLPASFWDPSMQIYRYLTVEFSGELRERPSPE